MELSKPSAPPWESRRCRGPSTTSEGSRWWGCSRPFLSAADIPPPRPFSSSLQLPCPLGPLSWSGPAPPALTRTMVPTAAASIRCLPVPASAPPPHRCFRGGLSRKLLPCPCQGLLLGEPRLSTSHSAHTCPAHAARPCLFLSRQGQASLPRLRYLWPSNIRALSNSLHRSWALRTPGLLHVLVPLPETLSPRCARGQLFTSSCLSPGSLCASPVWQLCSAPWPGFAESAPRALRGHLL